MQNRLGLVVGGLVAVILLCWMLLVPQGGQPDEHSHLVRSAALIRGVDESGPRLYVLPDRYVVADPGCYAFQPNMPATCATIPNATGTEVELLTRADDYPWGGHLVYGAVTLLPGLAPVWWGRLGAVAIGAALLTAAMVRARRSDSVSVGALLLGLTPMAWAIIPAVNPSSMVTAGAAALWVGLLLVRSDRDLSSGHRWLIALAWAATALPRRDGLAWACLIAAFALALTRADLLQLGRRLGAAASAVIVASTLVVIVWGLTSDANVSALVVAAPLALVGADWSMRWWRTQQPPRNAAAIAGAVVAIVGAVGWVLMVSTRPGGWNTDLVFAVIGQTDENVIEAIGVLGWLDTSIPQVAVFAWLILVGVLVAGAITANRSALLAAGLLAGAAALTSWTFELLQGNVSGTYWQGRYSLPLLAGVPVLLAWRPERAPADARHTDPPDAGPFDAIAGVGGLVLLNVAAWSAARRWGVGTVGSYLPWRWDTPIQPLPVLLLLVVHAAATGALAHVLLGRRVPAR